MGPIILMWATSAAIWLLPSTYLDWQLRYLADYRQNATWPIVKRKIAPAMLSPLAWAAGVMAAITVGSAFVPDFNFKGGPINPAAGFVLASVAAGVSSLVFTVFELAVRWLAREPIRLLVIGMDLTTNLLAVGGVFLTFFLFQLVV